MKFTSLSKKLTNNLSDAELSLIEKAYKFADKAHEGQMRVSGEPFIEHSIAVTDILVDLGLPAVVLVSALLHDVVEDSTVSLKLVERTFGNEVALMVDGVTKLTGQVQRQHSGDKSQSLGSEYRHTKYISDDQAENIRKTFLAMSDDVRIVIIKLADRLHNMRTLNSLSRSR